MQGNGSDTRCRRWMHRQTHRRAAGGRHDARTTWIFISLIWLTALLVTLSTIKTVRSDQTVYKCWQQNTREVVRYGTGHFDACTAALLEWMAIYEPLNPSFYFEHPSEVQPLCTAHSRNSTGSKGLDYCYYDLYWRSVEEFYSSTHERMVWENNGICPDGQPIHVESGCGCPDDEPFIDGQCGCKDGKVYKQGQCIRPPIACEEEGSIGNPCDAATGNKFEIEVDFAGGFGVPGLTRTYNSGQSVALNLGHRWTSSLNKRILADGDQLVVHRTDGSEEPWTRVDGVWEADPDHELNLTEEADEYVVAYPDGNVDRYKLSTGQIVSETTAAGLSTTYQYNGTRLKSVTGPFGHTVTITSTSANGLIYYLQDAAGASYRYSYDRLIGNLTRVSYPGGGHRYYYYDDPDFPHHLTRIKDANGDTFATFAYDSEGRAISTQHAETDNGAPQEKFLLDYSASPTAVVTDPAGELWHYSYEQNLGIFNLIGKSSQTDGKGIHQRFDARNNLISHADEEGRVTTHTYNATNQRVSTTEAFGTAEARTTGYEYVSPDIDLLTRVSMPSVNAGSVREVLNSYDAQLNVTGITIKGFTPDGTPVSRTTMFQYNSLGQATRIDGPRMDVDDVTSLTYYECNTGFECGQIASVTNALGHTTTYDAYSGLGLLTQSTDSLGVVTTYSYDGRNRVTGITQTPPAAQGDPRITTYSYNDAGQMTSVTTPDGVTLIYTYDAAHNLRSIVDSLGNTVEYDYDLKGNQIRKRIKDPDGALVRGIELVYDLRDRIQSIDAAGSITRTLRDATGNLVVETDPNLNPSTRHSYDDLDRLHETLDALTHSTGYHYDVQDNLIQVNAPNSAVTTYTYDDLGNLLEEISPDRGVLTYSHDAAGNIVSVTDARGVTATYDYDALGRVTDIDYPGVDRDQSLSYDGCVNGTGRLCGMTDQSGVAGYAYDVFGNITQYNKDEDGGVHTTTYQYDAGNRITHMTYPHGGTLTYGRDVLGRIVDASLDLDGVVIPIINQRGYQADGAPTTQTLGNGLLETRRYDLQGRLVAQDLGVLDNRTYRYDPNGNLLQREQTTRTDPGSLNGSYRYDVLDRLTFDARSTGDFQFTYDENGNRLTRTVNGNTKEYTYTLQSNRLTIANNKNVVLDPAGYTLSDRNGRRSYAYDDTGRLMSFFRKGHLVGTYIYNAFGQRTRKVIGPKTYIYHYDVRGNLIAETRNGKAFKYYVRVDNQPVAQIRLKQRNNGDVIIKNTTYITTDHLLTPRLGTDEAQIVVWRWDSDAFGRTRPDKYPDAKGKKRNIHLRFPGQYYDSESRLHYNWNRYYDPQTGRYITSDPIGLDGGVNTYWYVRGNPFRYIDPTGLVDYGDLAFGVVDFGLSMGEAVIGVGVMTASTATGPGAVFGYAGGAAIAAHGILGMVNAGIDIRNACYDTDNPGVVETLGETLMGDSGAKVGRAIGLMMGVRPAMLVTRGPESAKDVYDLLRGSKSMGDAFSEQHAD